MNLSPMQVLIRLFFPDYTMSRLLNRDKSSISSKYKPYILNRNKIKKL